MPYNEYVKKLKRIEILMENVDRLDIENMELEFLSKTIEEY